jgi:oligoribonuclease
MKKSKTHMVWIDLEMTGLDPERERILEIATVVTNKSLEKTAVGPNLVIHQPDSILEGMNRWNRKHHGKSGLTDAAKRSCLSVAEAEDQTLEFLNRWCHRGVAPLCGNSVYVDRRFIIKYMPKLDAFLHYRLVDVSTLKELAARWYPKPKEKFKKKDAHRSLDDVLESIEELKFFRRLYFKKRP